MVSPIVFMLLTIMNYVQSLTSPNKTTTSDKVATCSEQGSLTLHVSLCHSACMISAHLRSSIDVQAKPCHHWTLEPPMLPLEFQFSVDGGSKQALMHNSRMHSHLKSNLTETSLLDHATAHVKCLRLPCNNFRQGALTSHMSTAPLHIYNPTLSDVQHFILFLLQFSLCTAVPRPNTCPVVSARLMTP